MSSDVKKKKKEGAGVLSVMTGCRLSQSIIHIMTASCSDENVIVIGPSISEIFPPPSLKYTLSAHPE